MSSRRLFLARTVALALPPRWAIAQAPVHMVVGTVPVDGGISPIVLLRGGFYKKYGLDVELRLMTSGAALAAALIGGSLNLVGASTVGVITAHVKGIPFQIIAPGGTYDSAQPAEMLVVRKDGPIHSGADLNGRTIASSSLGDIDSVAVSAWIDQHGGDSKTVRHVELPPPATPPAIEAGRIDGAGLQEPVLSTALRSGTLRAIGSVYDAIGKHFLVSEAIVMADFANANRDLVVRYLHAQLEANAFANTHHEQTAHWLAEAAGMDVNAILHTQRKSMAENLDVAMIQPVLDAVVRYGVIEKPFDPRDLFSPTVLGTAGR